VIRKHTRRAAKAAFAISLGVAIVIGTFAGAARSATAASPTIVIGTKNFGEEFILGQLYKQALEAKGFKVNLKNNIGSSEIIDKALTSGKIDAYPEYAAVITGELAHENGRPKSADETYKKAKAFEEKRGFTLLGKSPGQDADVNVVKPAYAKKHGLKTTADLKKVSGFKFGAPPENKTRFQGALGMKKVYGLNFKFVPLAIGLRYQALDSGKVDVIAGFTTEGQLVDKSKYQTLSDPKNIFGYQNIAPVVNKKKLAKWGPGFTQTMNAVTATLTNEALAKMNGAVDLDKQKPADVAGKFLQANGLK